MEIELPSDVLDEVRLLVEEEEYPDEQTAIVALVRIGMEARSGATALAGPGAVPEAPDPWEGPSPLGVAPVRPLR